MYTNYELRQMPLSVDSSRRVVEEFLHANGLSLDDLDYYVGVFLKGSDEMLAGAGKKGDVIKCVAVEESQRDEGFTNRIVSHLVNLITSEGYTCVKVFTKPCYREVFESLAFSLLADTPHAVLLENGHGLADYRKYLTSRRREGRNGVIVINGNPFTRGHRYLVEQAARQVDYLYVIPVKEDASMFSYEERKDMMKDALSDITNIDILEGSDYAISAATFPSYFIKKMSNVTESQTMMDLKLFSQHIAPSLGVSVRFVGSEPTDKLTSYYNERMRELLPSMGIDVVEIERLRENGSIISASRLRRFLADGNLSEAAHLAYSTTIPYLIAHLATMALQTELDTTPKPGLVDRHDSGAHHDMDYSLMQRSINTLHPYFVRLALAGWQKEIPAHEVIQGIGVECEEAMLRATGGVNTHKGALFSMGITVVAASHLWYENLITSQPHNLNITISELRQTVSAIARRFPKSSGTHGSIVTQKYNLKGARDHAIDGYPLLFGEWLPYYAANKNHDEVNIRTLLLIMSELEDTNIYYRKDAKTAEDVKRQSRYAFDNYALWRMETMNDDFIHRNISPGGAADMLSLTIFVNSIIKET